MTYEPTARYHHVAAAIGSKLFLWGGKRETMHLAGSSEGEVNGPNERMFAVVRSLMIDLSSHDGPDKKAINSVVHILDVKVCLLCLQISYTLHNSADEATSGVARTDVLPGYHNARRENFAN